MRYIKLENNNPVNYSIEQFAIDYPTIYSTNPIPDCYVLAQYNVYLLVTTNPPTLTEGQIAEEGTPSFYNDEWHQTWTTRESTEEEIDEMIRVQIPIPASPEIALEFFASDELMTQRSEICSSCPSYTKLKVCMEYGYIMPLKAVYKSTVCPIGKW